MARPLYTHQADSDLEQIAVVIGRVGGPRAADRFLDEFRAQADFYAQFPALGIPREDVTVGFRSFVVRKYVACYAEVPGTIRISRVLHGSADAAAELGPP